MVLKPQSTLSLRHIALFIQNFPECIHFYTEILGMSVEWQPDENNIYLTFGSDNLALHRRQTDFSWSLNQRLDHIGFMLKTREEVDAWYDYLHDRQVAIKTAPRAHRDGARSFYCFDPDGNNIQMIYHPPVSSTL